MKKTLLLFGIFALLLTVQGATAGLSDGQQDSWTYDNSNLSGSNPLDVVNSNNGSNSGATTGASGKLGEAFSYDGSSNYVSYSTTSYIGKGKNFSVAAWINPDDTSGTHMIVKHQTGSNDRFALQINTGVLTSGIYDGTGYIDPQSNDSFSTTGSWVFVLVTNTQGDDMTLYQDCNIQSGTSLPNIIDRNEFTTGVDRISSPIRFFDGGLDEVYTWDRTLTSTDCDELYNSGAGNQYPYLNDEPTIGVINITPLVPDSDDNITGNATVTTGEGGNYNLTTKVYLNSVLNKTTSHGELSNGTSTVENFDCSTLTCNDGDNITFEYNASNADGSDIQNATVEIQDQGFISVQAFEKISGDQIQSFNSTSPEVVGTSNGTLIIQTDVGTRSLTVNADISGYLNTITNGSVEVVKQETTSVNLTGFYTSNVTLNVTDGNNGSSVSNMTISLSSNDFPSFEENKTSADSGTSYGLINGTYSLSITHPLYAEFSTTINITNTTTLDIQLYPDPSSVRVTVRKEEDGSLLNSQNVTLTVANDIGEDVFIITNATKFVGNLTPDNYTFKFQSTGYSTRSYALQVGENTTQTLTAYLAQTNQTVIFTVIDDNTLAPISNSDVLIERSINGTWTTVENRKTDVTGRVQFTFIIGEAYRITADATGYTSRTFTLDPILFTSYNIPLSKTSTVQSRINTRLEPVNPRFIEGETTTVNFTFVAPGGNLQSYSLTFTTPDSNTVTRSGTQATGQTFTNINIPTGTVDIGDQVKLEYSYTDTNGDIVTKVRYFGVLDDQIQNNTFANNINKTYGGFGDFERIITVGAGAAGAGGLGGIVAGTSGAVLFILAIYSYAAYAGIINAWSIAITVIIGIGMLWFRGGR